MKIGLIVIIKLESKFQIGKFSGAIKISEPTAVSILITLCVIAYILF